MPKNKNHSKKTLKTVEDILNEPRYEEFVKKLGIAAKDPKLRAVFYGGLLDGELMDDLVQHDEIIRMGRNLKPIQYEIDLESSLKWVGKNVENVPLILKGGTLGSKHFGGNPIVTGTGSYLIDGHHRWSQVYMINPEARIEAINLHIDNPKNALRKSQIAIAAMSGEVPVGKVQPGKNIYRMKASEIKRTIPKYLSKDFYNAFYKTDATRFRDETDVVNHIYKNIMMMRRQNPPRTDIGRELMPQYGTVGVSKAMKALASGKINIKPPYMKKRNYV